LWCADGLRPLFQVAQTQCTSHWDNPTGPKNVFNHLSQNPRLQFIIRSPSPFTLPLTNTRAQALTHGHALRGEWIVERDRVRPEDSRGQ